MHRHEFDLCTVTDRARAVVNVVIIGSAGGAPGNHSPCVWSKELLADVVAKCDTLITKRLRLQREQVVLVSKGFAGAGKMDMILLYINTLCNVVHFHDLRSCCGHVVRL